MGVMVTVIALCVVSQLLSLCCVGCCHCCLCAAWGSPLLLLHCVGYCCIMWVSPSSLLHHVGCCCHRYCTIWGIAVTIIALYGCHCYCCCAAYSIVTAGPSATLGTVVERVGEGDVYKTCASVAEPPVPYSAGGLMIVYSLGL